MASLDALAYGGLVQSRHLPLAPEDALARLAPLLAWKARGGGALYLFGVVPRWDASRRERNLRVLRALASWRGLRGVYLEAVWDDALRNSPGPREARALGYPARPGADEAGQVLLLRAFRPGLRVAVVVEEPVATSGQRTELIHRRLDLVGDRGVEGRGSLPGLEEDVGVLGGPS